MKKKNTFTKIPDALLATKKLTPSQKLIIAYVLRWQSSGKVCFESNQSLALRFGLSVSSLKKHITQLNKLDFFLSEETSEFNEFGKWTNSKRMTIDETKLNQLLMPTGTSLKPANSKDNLDEVLDNFEDFKSYVTEYSKGKATEKSIQYYYEFMKNGNIPRTPKNINVLFRKGR